MKKWTVIEQNLSGSDVKDEFLRVFESKEKAIEEAGNLWDSLTSHEKKIKKVYAVLVNLELENGNWIWGEDSDWKEIGIEYTM